jgi:hypothetical protein
VSGEKEGGVGQGEDREWRIEDGGKKAKTGKHPTWNIQHSTFNAQGKGEDILQPTFNAQRPR